MSSPTNLAMAKDVETKEQIASTAAISAGGDAGVGETIAERWTRSAKKASSRWRRARPSASARAHRGNAFRQGYISPYFVTDAGAWRPSSKTRTCSS